MSQDTLRVGGPSTAVAVAKTVPVIELRTPDEAFRLLARIYPAEGWLEIKDHNIVYRIDIRSLLLGKSRTNTDEMRISRAGRRSGI